MTEEYIQFLEQRIRQGWDLAHDSKLLLCRVPAGELENNNSQKALNLLRAAMARPDHSLVLATAEGLIFGFTDQKAESNPVSQTTGSPMRVSIQTASVV